MSNWLPAPKGQINAVGQAANLTNNTGSVSYTLTGASPRFVRLKVTPN